MKLREARDELRHRVVLLYNKFMGGVDLVDQLSDNARITRKSERWSATVKGRLLDWTLTNKHTILRQRMKKLNRKTFKRD